MIELDSFDQVQGSGGQIKQSQGGCVVVRVRAPDAVDEAVIRAFRRSTWPRLGRSRLNLRQRGDAAREQRTRSRDVEDVQILRGLHRGCRLPREASDPRAFGKNIASYPRVFGKKNALYPRVFGNSCRPSNVRDDDLRRLLVQSNPWWKLAGGGQDPTAWVANHVLLRDRQTYDLGYRSRVLQDLETDSLGDALVVLTGPRRVGKSVALLDLAAALCRRPDVDPRQVIHVPCDGMADRDLRRALVQGRALTAVVDRLGTKSRVWLLDEVSGIHGWTATIKQARDQTALRGDTVILSGSRWLATEDVQGNLLAGRAGTTAHRRVRHLHPMPFRDFLTAVRPEIPRPPPVHPADLRDPAVQGALEDLRVWTDEYDLAWQDYLTVGGFPRAVAEWRNAGNVSTAYLQDLAAWLRRDVEPDARADSLPILLSTLAQHQPNPLSVRGTGAELRYVRYDFETRLSRLTSGFAALWCPKRDDAGGAVAGAQAKLYLTDPILSWLPSTLRAGLPSPDMTHLTEAAIGVALARVIDALQAGRWVASDTIGYVNTRSGHEVDFAPVPVPAGGQVRMTVPLEGKWVDTGWRKEALVIEGKYPEGILATKSILDMTYPAWAVPAPLVALLLE